MSGIQMNILINTLTDCVNELKP